jgi:hypothetical protein
MAYTAWSVVYGEQPTAAKWNQLGANDAGFKDGTNIDNNAILDRHIAASARLNTKIIFATKVLTVASGNTAYTGVGFKPTAIFAMFYGPGLSTHGFGIIDKTTASGVGVNGAGVAYQDSTTTIFSLSPGSGLAFNATLVSLDADGFTLNWTKIGAPTGTSQLAFLCFR